MRVRRSHGLSERDQAVLALERRWGAKPSSQPAKYAAARIDLGLDPGGYTLILNSLLHDPAAREFDRETVDRLVALRAGRVPAAHDATLGMRHR